MDLDHQDMEFGQMEADVGDGLPEVLSDLATDPGDFRQRGENADDFAENRQCFQRPTLLMSADDRTVLSVATSAYNAIALTCNGNVLQWGRYGCADVLPNLRATQIAASCPGLDIWEEDDHFACIDRDGQLLTWGWGQFGQLGCGVVHAYHRTPRLFEWGIDQGLHITSVACGCAFTAFVGLPKVAGSCTELQHRAWWFGSMKDDRYSLDAGVANVVEGPFCRFKPFLLAAKNVKEVCCGGYHLGIVTLGGDLLTMGVAEGGWSDGNYTGHGRPWVDTEVPKVIEGFRGNVSHAAAGQIMMGCVTKDGRVFTWGDGDSGSLGILPMDGADGFAWHHCDIPTQVASLDGQGVACLRFSFGNSAALTEDGRVFFWGVEDPKWPTYPGVPSAIPKQLMLPTEGRHGKLIDCAVGARHTLAVADARPNAALPAAPS
eukprot:gnl/MRDRNA2_/MRDRNA2_197952_c0_seq1.p1 gnl/MRDRNA2_/MRDRNA2_197952_c0~~gnl/MRDRNA2_/MRDRNA2_197952_c0_seq1.p1  ORF type:complete len:484 (+),score=73.93 gnl/MRDRNA2_/MRDRNA2_197952_c0_seq1:157-1452(+)